MSDRHTQKPYPLRMPDEMRTKLEDAATKGGRSLHAEILRRLEWSLPIADEPVVENAAPVQQPIAGALSWFITSEIKKLAEQEGIHFDEMLAKIVIAGIHPTAPQVLYLPLFPGATSADVRAALQATDGIVRPDATIVSEKFAGAPWAPEWMVQRLNEARSGADMVLMDANGNATLVEIKSKRPLGSKKMHESLPKAADVHPNLVVGDNVELPGKAKRVPKRKIPQKPTLKKSPE